MPTFYRPCVIANDPDSLGATIFSAYTLTFQTHLFSILPPSFARGFKALCASTLPDSRSPVTSPNPQIWVVFETLGLIDRYESIIASVGYEHIEAHVLSTCAGEWSKPMMDGLRNWMSDNIVPWMLLTYARGASNSVWFHLHFYGSGLVLKVYNSGRSTCDAARRRISVRLPYEQDTMRPTVR